MLHGLYEKLMVQSPAAVVVITVAIMLLGGFLMTRITKKLHLPNVTAYILTGILAGPFCLDLIPSFMVEGTTFLADVALAFIAFSTGQFLKASTLRKNAGKVLTITVLESLTASVLVFLLLYWVLGLKFSLSIVLAALACATAPASLMMTIRQTRASGDFVDTLLQVIAYDNMLALLAFGVAVSAALSSEAGAAVTLGGILLPVGKNLGVFLLGLVFGLFLKLLIQKKRSTDNRLIILVALLFAFCGICAGVGVSPLLGCMSMGSLYISLTGDDKLFKQLNYFSPPILLLFFVRSGVVFGFNAQSASLTAAGNLSLLLVGIAYFAARILGKFSGAFLGCLAAGKPKETRNYFGLALIPQAGVAIGLAALGARALGGSLGMTLETVILASSVLYELIGPGCAKLALHLAHAYPRNLEEMVPLEEHQASGQEKTAVELLIERIEKIQLELEAVDEEEAAFTEAAEEHDSRHWEDQ